MTDNVPFLSVLLRTQGKRPEALTEALASLKNQTDGDFRVILLVHNADEAGKACIEKILMSEPREFTSKLRVEYVTGGTRTRPLNVGAALVETPYFAILDDDDIAYENWVENYKATAEKGFGKVIRAYGHTQLWQTASADDGTLSLSPVGEPKEQYCDPFDIIAHLEGNHTPISCVAIPTECFSERGIKFDEALTTTEDWDFIMRCIMTVGVLDSERISFLYRLWSNAETSHTLHSDAEWLENKHKIEKKLDTVEIHTTRRQLLHSKNNIRLRINRISFDKPFLQPTLKGAFKALWSNIRAWRNCKKNLKRYTEIIKASEHFDAKWYLEKYPDVTASGIDPAKHYLLYGWQELRNPSESFDTMRYLNLYPDVYESAVCPLLHYEISGKSEGREL